MCATDRTPLAGTPPLLSQELNWSWIRGSAGLFGVFLIGISLFTTWLMLWGGKIDMPTPEMLARVLWLDKFNAIPSPFGVSLLVLTLPWPRVWIRAALAILIGFVLWFFVWQWLAQIDYSQFPGIHVGALPGPRPIPMGLVFNFILAAIPTFLFQVVLICSLRAAERNLPDNYDEAFCAFGGVMMWAWAAFLFFGEARGEVSLLLFLVGAAVCIVGMLPRRKP